MGPGRFRKDAIEYFLDLQRTNILQHPGALIDRHGSRALCNQQKNRAYSLGIRWYAISATRSYTRETQETGTPLQGRRPIPAELSETQDIGYPATLAPTAKTLPKRLQTLRYRIEAPRPSSDGAAFALPCIYCAKWVRHPGPQSAR